MLYVSGFVGNKSPASPNIIAQMPLEIDPYVYTENMDSETLVVFVNLPSMQIQKP